MTTPIEICLLTRYKQPSSSETTECIDLLEKPCLHKEKRLKPQQGYINEEMRATVYLIFSYTMPYKLTNTDVLAWILAT